MAKLVILKSFMDSYYDNMIEKSTSHKYIRRVPKSNGKGYNYFYPEDFKKPLKALLSFFGMKEDKIDKAYENNNINQAYGVTKQSFAQHVLEYLTNRKTWNTFFANKVNRDKYKVPEKPVKETETVKVTEKEIVGGKTKEKLTVEEKETKEKNFKSTWNRSLMRKIYSMYNSVPEDKAENNPGIDTIKVGDSVSYNGRVGKVTKDYENGMMFVNFEGGGMGRFAAKDLQKMNPTAEEVTETATENAEVQDINGTNEPVQTEIKDTSALSEAMMGNQNAKKYGLTDEQIEYYDIQEVVEEINGYPIVKNSKGKYSFVAEGRVKDRPEDFETNIDKIKERINDHYETEKNIKAAKNFDFKNAKLGSDVQYTKKNNGNHLYFKKSPDGSKVLSVTVNVSDMREPLNMVYEVSDTKTGESWQYETAYGNKEGLEWAVERPEQMEKEIKKFFKRDPNKEWEKQNTFDKEPSGIGTFEKIDEKTVEMPTDKATRVLFDNLNKSRSTDIVREFMTDCYYDGENLVATDGKRLTIIKTGDVGFEPGYVNVKTDDGKITLERIEGKDKKYSFPNYKKVIPENNNQEVKLDNKALKDKLKQMKKEGAFNKKNPRVNLVFEDGKVMLDGTLIGTGDVKFKDGENYVSFNGDFLNDAVLSGDNMSMSFGENSEKAVVFGSDIGKTVVMPMVQTPVDYENNRAIKKQSSNEKAAKLSNNRKENERLVNDSFKDIDGQVEKVYTNLDKKINAFSDEDLKRSYDILNLNLDKIMDRSIGFITKIVDKKTNATFSTAYAYSKLLEKHPDVKDKFLAELDRRGISVKKSLFDDLFEIEVIEDEEVEEDPEENDSLFNDYSAEQPEFFNSTELMVSEAFNRCRVL